MSTPASNFIRDIVSDDLEQGRHGGIITRFPPEPNGYLHIGHAKSICLNFGLARDFGGRCNLRFDDTNPVKEDMEFVESIQADVRWLGFEWTELRHASDYFRQMYEYALILIRDGKAYVDEQSAEAMRANRGTLTEPGRNSPWRDRPIEENLARFEQMRRGELDEGAAVLRAKIDMGHGNINLRDPAIYRIRKVPHQMTGEAWCIYPMYDYAHCISDALEHITHSLCTLEFEDHRPLYDWFLAQLPVPSRPRQIEFARLNLDYTVMSKRKLAALVAEGLVEGWDDPRMPTISGLRRRGCPPEAIRDFAERIGITKKASLVEVGVLENCIREELDRNAPRRLAVLDPVKVVLTNFPEGETEWLSFPNHPQRPELGTREVPLSRELWIDAEDFLEVPPKGYHRLVPGGEVRLRGAFIIRCESVEKDADGRVVALHCSVDHDSRSGAPGSQRKVKGTIHWLSAAQAVAAEVRLYDRLFRVASPDDGDYHAHLNPDSKRVVGTAYVEPSLATAEPESRWQFERTGYFVADRHDHRPGERLVFNRTVTLRDSWAKAR